MGTSASSTGPNNKSPLLPPWAEQGNPVQVGVGDGSGQDGGADQQAPESNEPSQEVDNGQVQEQIPGPIPNIPSPNRLTGARRAFGDYAKPGGNSSNLRGSLKKYAKSSGGGSGTSRRLASGITAGSGLLGMMQGDSVRVNDRTLSLSDLNGLSTDQAIDRISEHLTPENGDANSVRLALDFALAEVLPEEDTFDESMFTDEVVQEAISCYLTDLIFQDVVNGMGKAWFHAEHPSKHHRMEEELRDLIKVITQSKVEKVTSANGGNISQDNITKIQIDAISQTVDEWETFNG
ncbi:MULTISPECIES: hypothetical protein [unclassified Vibrio]|uniref:hypothetical protein n=1 Tax=unclassified Vibrio TaxID=2614977 RepID=UPI000B8E6679|nr:MULTISPECIES: hypothetical protein [unclassified Vibrio]NAW91317.1 hypothetical protein [Vibrio sp. V24_P1S3T111]OXX20973.1 hypothetical protein B9J86_11770 [Vibrio sp. V06_P1A73T115]OXX26535.1 hypothetical protein B9J88_01950 [Vibrio sp. V05_P4A8T149]OXX28038.1 hypothetical protein B9J95_17715 [Vibrio sp. V14_P6S14T42]OXX38657.1 hypothetical protein B9J81_01325 [Vibrio sp. V04_P4A5T148]